LTYDAILVIERRKMRKHFVVSDEIHAKVVDHLEKKEVKVYIQSWVEKACLDLIKKEQKGKI